MIPGAEDEILKPDRMEMMRQEQQALHRSVSEGHLLKTQISIKEEVAIYTKPIPKSSISSKACLRSMLFDIFDCFKI